MFQKKKEFSEEEIKELEKSKRLKITNLKHGISDKQLTDHIRKETEITPKSVEIHRHSEGQYPSFAFVQMEKKKHTKKAMEKLQMTSFQGQKMWIRHCRDTVRNEHLKGCTSAVCLEHLPLETNETSDIQKIKKLCAKHGKVKFVKLHKRNGYFGRSANVIMSKCEEADAVFDALHETEIGGCTITTRFISENANSNCLSITGLPKTVTKPDICELVKEAVDERPLCIRINPPNDKFSNSTAI